jgi:hypothetical protein
LSVSSSAKKKSDKNGGISWFLDKDYRVLVSLLFPPNRGFGGSAPNFDRLLLTAFLKMINGCFMPLPIPSRATGSFSVRPAIPY